jgi:membrane-bound lytic murein transglycosylase F
MTTLYRYSLQKIVIVISFVLVLAGCQIDSKPKSELDQIRARGVLRIGTLNNQLSYYIGPDGPSGLDYELAREFANQLGVKLEITPIYRASALFPALENGEIDIVAGGQIQTPERIKKFRPGPAYYYVSQQLVYKKGGNKPNDIADLIKTQNTLLADSDDIGRILRIVEGSHFQQTLEAINQGNPELSYALDKNSDVNDLLKQVSEGTLAYTVADSVEISLAQRISPDIASAFELTEDQPISWFLRRSDDESFYAMIIEFFGNQNQSGSLASLEEKYIGHIGSFDYVDTRAFIRALDSKLEDWRALFQLYADEFDWRLIAALSYQESHWDPKAKSPTGVRGMMMLTLPTAKSVGVTDRLDPEQSIRGGVDYFRRMFNRIPDSVPDHEKTWFALASYNMGFGHIMDARRLTKQLGGDPDAWSDVKEHLPLLRQKKYFSQTRYGYARGDEALSYVENIRRYYQSIIGHIDEKQPNNTDTSTDDIAVIPVEPIDTSIEPQPADAELTTTSTASVIQPTANETTAEVADTSQSKTDDVKTTKTDAAKPTETDVPNAKTSKASESKAESKAKADAPSDTAQASNVSANTANTETAPTDANKTTENTPGIPLIEEPLATNEDQDGVDDRNDNGEK